MHSTGPSRSRGVPPWVRVEYCSGVCLEAGYSYSRPEAQCSAAPGHSPPDGPPQTQPRCTHSLPFGRHRTHACMPGLCNPPVPSLLTWLWVQAVRQGLAGAGPCQRAAGEQRLALQLFQTSACDIISIVSLQPMEKSQSQSRHGVFRPPSTVQLALVSSRCRHLFSVPIQTWSNFRSNFLPHVGAGPHLALRPRPRGEHDPQRHLYVHPPQARLNRRAGRLLQAAASGRWRVQVGEGRCRWLR